MNLTLESDYAIRIVTYIARVDKRVDATTISNETEVTLRFSLKILRKLVADGILRSYKGITGGYQLNKRASEITLKDIIEVIEGKYAFSRCLNPDCGCSRTNTENSINCKVRKIFKDISDTVNEKLEKITVEQLL